MKEFFNKFKYQIIGITGILIFFVILLFINKNFSNNDLLNNSNSGSSSETIISDSQKIISGDTQTINPQNYDSLEEFLTYFNTGTGIVHDVDLLNENFYIKIYQGEYFAVTKFSPDLISDIDSKDNEIIKNQAILDIFNFYKKEKYIYGEANDTRSGVRLLTESELKPNMQFHNSFLLPYSGENSFETLKRLENISNKTIEEKQQLAYIYDFFGDYNKSETIKQQTGISKINYTITGKVTSLGNGIKGVKVELLNYDNILTYTDDDGNYKLEFKTYPMSRIRLRASMDSFSDAFNGVYIVFDYDNQSSENIDFILHNVDTKILIKNSELTGGKTKIVQSSIGNTFEFKQGVLLDENKKIYNGDFYVNIFEFNRNTQGMNNYLRLDNFDSLYGYTGNMMITNGMTYLLVYDINGNQLYISKKNPIITRQKIDIDYLINNNLDGDGSLKQEQLDLLLDISKLDGYPIDRELLITRGITGFIPWWVLNVEKGIWENQGIRLLDKTGLKEGLYYNVD